MARLIGGPADGQHTDLTSHTVIVPLAPRPLSFAEVVEQRFTVDDEGRLETVPPTEYRDARYVLCRDGNYRYDDAA